MPKRLLISLMVLGAMLAASCGTTKASRRFTREETAAQLKKLEVVSLELGEFPIDGSAAVIDGDTIRVKGLNASLRLLGIDTEETFKHNAEREAFAAGWESYKKKMRGGSSRPVKMATPLGDQAKDFAQHFFDGVSSVRIERDHPGEIRDFYGRYLAYIMVQKDGVWLNYNVECVRAGFSPYFMKYGRSRRFHQAFIDAQAAARASQLGIWKPGAMHYDDYDERLKWWGEREAAITRFEKEQDQNPESMIALTRYDAMLKLEQRVGQETIVLGSVQEIARGDKGPTVVKLARSRVQTFDIVFFDKDVLIASGLQFKRGEYVQVRGKISKYRDTRGRDHLQLQVSLPGQVLAPSEQLEKMLIPERPASKLTDDDDDREQSQTRVGAEKTAEPEEED